MTAHMSYRHTDIPATREEDYTLYSLSGVPPHTPSYSPVYVRPQLPTTHEFDVYRFQPDYTFHPHVNYPLDTQSKYVDANPQVYSSDYSPTNSATRSFNTRPPFLSSTSDSGVSVQSNISSATGSPLLSVEHPPDWHALHGVVPNISHPEDFQQKLFLPDHLEYETLAVNTKPGCVDPSLIQPFSPTPPSARPCSELSVPRSPKYLFPHPPSPAPTTASNKSHNVSGVLRTNSIRATSPNVLTQPWNPYPSKSSPRRESTSSTLSHRSRNSQSSLDSEENKGVCPIASCGRHIKDLKAHLLTHKNERPEKCPISSCEYHTKGFARKYDKNRHTLTHYKGTMVCGFCPGSGSPSEKSFNRADVFKRHLTSVHGVEQTAPNSRRRSGSGGANGKKAFGTMGVSGMCSTCSVTFANVQDFYEHLDDCVLRVVQQTDPCEAINERILNSMTEDKAVRETMERHSLVTGLDYSGPKTNDDDEEDDEEEERRDSKDGLQLSRKSSRTSGGRVSPTHASISIKGIRCGLTYSKGGVALRGDGKGNKRRKNYPSSWNAASEKTRMKRRVLCVFDGPRRLWKDDMMLSTDHEVREPLPGGDGRNWITSLDVQTLRRAEGILEATDEEKGPWTNEHGMGRLMSISGNAVERCGLYAGFDD